MVKFKVNNSYKYFIAFIISILFVMIGAYLTGIQDGEIKKIVGCVGVFIGGYWIGLIQKTMENIK